MIYGTVNTCGWDFALKNLAPSLKPESIMAGSISMSLHDILKIDTHSGKAALWDPA